MFERGISLGRHRGMSISHSPDAILSQFEDNAMWHLQVGFQLLWTMTTLSDLIQNVNPHHFLFSQLSIQTTSKSL